MFVEAIEASDTRRLSTPIFVEISIVIEARSTSADSARESMKVC
jgi:hypothetical protein